MNGSAGGSPTHAVYSAATTRKALGMGAAFLLAIVLALVAISGAASPAWAKDASGTTTNRVELRAQGLEAQTAAWDGETLLEPAKSGNVYQIAEPAELAWFAAQVNAGDGAAYNAELANDIDLGEMPWTPIGNSTTKKFTGTFDGAGHTITGLSCHITSWAPAGLFGVIDKATIKNVTVSGSVSAADFYAAGGIAARAENTSTITNCGNLATVSNTSTSGRAAGIVGWMYGAGSITGCFNRAAITGNARTAGIVADSEMGSTVRNCYNSGSVTGAQAYGVCFATNVSTCYNAGELLGSSKAYIAYANGSKDAVFYLEGCTDGTIEDADTATEVTATDFKAPAFAEALGESWQVDVGGAVNGGFPLLAWEPVSAASGVALQAPSNLTWLLPEPDDETDYDIAYEMMQVSWRPVEGASGYKVKLYRTDAPDEPVFVSDELTDTVLDLYDVFANLNATDAATYAFSVTAIGDGTYYLDSEESPLDGEGFAFDGAAFIAPPQSMTWNDASKIAVWSRVADADFYLVSLYRGSTEVADYELDKAILGSSSANVSMQFLNQMTGTGDYYFTVRAGKYVQSGDLAGKRAASALATSSTTHFEAAQGETIEISSADDWMRIVNLSHEGTAFVTDADAQTVEWAKNYVITEDLDFSNLSAEQLAQSKSWGNVDAYFNGTLDGQGHTIRGLTLANGDNGLFTYIGTKGTVKNLTVEAANVLFNDNAGIFCQYNYGTISNCAVINTNISSDYSGVIAGFMARNFGLVQDCYVEGGTLSTTTQTANGHAGFVGNNSGTIRRCWTSMDVSTASYCAGAFCGWADERYNQETGTYDAAVFQDCFALGDVSAERGWSGGFIGRVNSSKARFENCYAAGTVTSSLKPERAHGFIGAMGSEAAIDLGGSGAFHIVLPAENCVNCFYCSDRTPADNEINLTTGLTLEQMRADDFAALLGLNWERTDGQNEGLPYLNDMAIPKASEQHPITVSLAVALYDKDDYAFVQDGQTVDVTFMTAGNTRVIDLMRAAAEQGLIEYEYTVTPAYGSFIESINGQTLHSPDGWMFTVNDDLSDVGVQLASVHDGDQVLWYQGMPANLFLPPTWQDVTGQASNTQWVDISTPDELVALSSPDADMDASYRLAADIDLAGVEFAGIGSYAKPFTGTFKGKGFTISNLKIDRPNDHNVGLFNFIRGAELNNIAVRNADVTGDYSVGILVGVADVMLDTTDRAKCIGNLIGGCSVSGKVASANVDTSTSSNGAYVGGLVGFNNGDADDKTGISVYSSIDRCVADAAVTGQAMYTGGLVGGNYGIVTNSSASGSVNGGDCTGGLFGGNVGQVYDSFSTGAVTGANRTGGFGGDNYNDAIERCYSTGNVIGSGDYVGGFVGDSGGTVKNCGSAGTVKAAATGSYVGGFIGFYTGSLSGLYVRITFEDNIGWSMNADGTAALPALGNKKTSTVEAEQAVLDATQATDWAVLQEAFADRYGVTLSEWTPETSGGGESGGDSGEGTGGSSTGGESGSGDSDEGSGGNSGSSSGGSSGSGSSSGSSTSGSTGSGTGGSSSASAGKPSADPASGSINAKTPTTKAANAAKAVSSIAKPNASKFKTVINPKTKRMKVTFARSKGAVNYRIAYRSVGAKKWTYTWTAGKLSHVLKSLKYAKLYEYRIAAFAKKSGVWKRSAWSAITRCWIAGTTVKLTPKKAAALATVGKLKTATGYKIRYSTKSTMAQPKTKTLKASAKKNTITLPKLKSGKKTYVQVTPYRTYHGKIYVGATSAKRAVKAK